MYLYPKLSVHKVDCIILKTSTQLWVQVQLDIIQPFIELVYGKC